MEYVFAREPTRLWLSNMEYAPLCEIMGRVGWASEVFNCSAPDTGNMEVLERYGNDRHKKEYMEPLLEGKIRSAFLMTEPAVASSDATNIETRIERDGDDYVINGRKWWSSGVGDPRCKIAIVMGKTNPEAALHQQQSQVLVPLDADGIEVVRMLPVLAMMMRRMAMPKLFLKDVRVPAENLLLGEGRGFEIAQGRLGPGRIQPLYAHHWRGRTRFGKNDYAAVDAQSLWQNHCRTQRVGTTHCRSAHQYRNVASAHPKSGLYDGYGGQQSGQKRDCPN